MQNLPENMLKRGGTALTTCSQCLLEQKRAVVEYASEHATVKSLTANQWLLANTLVTVLGPFETATRDCSRKDESASMIIPRVCVLFRKLEKLEESAKGVGTTVTEIKRSMEKRFGTYEH